MPIKNDTVLLVRHTYQDQWYLPGGGVKKQETLEQAIRRESEEEIGATLNKLELFGVYSNFYDYKNDHVAVFLSQSFSTNGNTDGEIEDVKAFSIDALPPDISPGSHRRLTEYIQGNFPHFGNW